MKHAHNPLAWYLGSRKVMESDCFGVWLNLCVLAPNSPSKDVEMITRDNIW